MSTFIPMVSSSPPPLDDTADDDDFGGFASAPASSKQDKFGDFAAFSEVIKDTVSDGDLFKPVAESGASDGDWMDDDPDFEVEPAETAGDCADAARPCVESAAASMEEVGRAADSPQPDLQNCNQTDENNASEDSEPEAESRTSTEKPSNLEISSCCEVDDSSRVHRLDSSSEQDQDQDQSGPIESPLSEDSPHTKQKSNSRPQKPDSQDNTSQGSMTDSGLCSDISPVPKFEDYPDFVESRASDGDIAELQPDARVVCERTCKEQSPGPSEGHSKDSDSGHGVEVTELTLPVGADSVSPPDEDAEDADISPNEETLVTGSVSDYQLHDSTSPEDAENDLPMPNTCTSKASEPEPLQFKPPSFSQDELEDLEDELDDSFGQFPPETCPASESEEDTFAARNISEEPESSASNEASSSEESAGRTKAEPRDHEPQDADDDDFGDFDNFKDHTDAGKGSKEVDDEFADFQSVDGNADQWAAFGNDSTPTNDDKAEDGGWAAFQEPAVPQSVDEDGDGDDEFGDFGDANVPAADSVAASLDLMQPGKKLQRALCSCFPSKADGSGTESLAVDLLLETVSMQVVRTQEVPESPRKALPGHDNKSKSRKVDVSVWNNLKDLDKTSALAFHWNKSFNHQRLLKSLTIDTRNILMGHKRQSVPIFASQLGMLEPSRGPAKKDDSQAELPAVDLHPKPAAVPATTPQDIPPAQFDWSRSGLTNPLDASSSMQLDLDFFVKNPTASCCSHAMRSEVLQKEQEILEAIEPGQGEQAPRQLEPLENLLASMNVTPTAPPAPNKEENQELSSEAEQVLQVLRDFSFMQATVLMFPYKEFGD